MAEKLRLAGIGTGGIWNWVHGPTWVKHPDVQLVAVCDIVKEKAERFAREHKVPNVCTDYRDVLAMADVDAVDICTPNLLHSEIAVAALGADKHVFTEKPDAINPAEAQKMADAAKASGKVLMAMRNNRFSPAAQFLRKYIAAGQMGEIYAGRCGWVRRRGAPGKGGWFTTKALSGGGPLIDLGVHFIDLATWLMGDPRPVSATGCTYTKFAGAKVSDSVHAAFGEKKSQGTFDVEDLAIGFLRFENGSSLQIEFSWSSNIEEEHNFIELRGTRSGCHLRNGQLKLFTESEGTLANVEPKLQGHRHGMNDHAAYLHHFVDVLLRGAEPIIRPEHGVNMIKILSAFYESAGTGSEVKL